MLTLDLPRRTNDRAFAAWLNAHPAAYHGDPAELARCPWTAWTDTTTDLSELAILVTQPHAVAAVQGLVGYFLSGVAALGGEWAAGPVVPTPHGQLFCFSLDGTKSARDDLYSVISDELETLLQVGSPVRKTDRAGAGTKGTRKWPGLQGPFRMAWR